MKTALKFFLLAMLLQVHVYAQDAEDEVVCFGDVFLTDGGKACLDDNGKIVYLDDLPSDVRREILSQHDPSFNDDFVQVGLTDKQKNEVVKKCGRDLACLNRETKKLDKETVFERDKRQQEEASKDTRYRKPSSPTEKEDPCKKYQFVGAKDAYLNCITRNQGI